MLRAPLLRAIAGQLYSVYETSTGPHVVGPPYVFDLISLSASLRWYDCDVKIVCWVCLRGRSSCCICLCLCRASGVADHRLSINRMIPRAPTPVPAVLSRHNTPDSLNLAALNATTAAVFGSLSSFPFDAPGLMWPVAAIGFSNC